MAMKVMGNKLYLAAAMFPLVLLLAGCIGEKVAPYGTVDVDVMDSASLEYTHVYITVNKIAFHKSKDAGTDAAGWEVVDISAQPVTIDLTQLANGKLYADTNAYNMPLFGDLEIPIGTYRQIRLYLASTEAAVLAPSAKALGLKYNNQAVLEDGGASVPVRIPNVSEGIKLIPEVPFEVAIGKHARLAIDFNLMDDMLDVYPEGQVECIMKPRLGYFDMASSGAIKGKIAFGNLSSPYFVIKAEQVVAGKPCRVVRRTATIDKKSGEYNLYPVPIFGNNTTAVYDILLRGENVQTAIIKNVKVRKGTTLSSGAVDLGTIVMNPGNEFKAQLLDPMHPTGAWINFYQTLTTDPVPFEVRNQHLDPYSGKFPCPIRLSSETIQVYDYSGGSLTGPVSDATTTPGEFSAIAEAVLYGRSNGVAVSGAANTTTTFTPDVMTALPSANRIEASITIPASLQASLNKGYLFITSGGLIVDCYSADSLVTAGGGLLNIPNLPGGSPSTPYSGALYGVNFIGWGNGSVVSGSQYNVDITTGNASASINLK
jgi:hypothetical protein